MAESPSGATVAKFNLQRAFSSPVAKIGIVVFVLVLIVCAGLAMHLLRKGGAKPGAAEGNSYNVSGQEPRGAVDPATAKAVEKRSDEASVTARGAGQSFGGPFVFESAEAVDQSGGSRTGFDETAGKSVAASRQASVVLTELRNKAAEYDSAEVAAIGASARLAASSGGGSRNGGSTSQGAIGQGMGMTQESFAQITKQLNAVGREQIAYNSLPNGILSRPIAVAVSAPARAEDATPSRDSTGAGAADIKKNPREEIAARAGDICAASAEASVNTDYSVPVFFELLECGKLTGGRVRGAVQKGPDDFTILFTALTLDSKRGYKLSGSFEGLSVSIKNDGSPGVADEVDRHWVTRLGSSALLSLARTERSFLTSRGSSSINTGVSSTVSIDPLSADEKRTARLAGLVEGSMDVVSRDLSTGINRSATMTLDKKTLVGVQFTSDVKVVPNE